MVVVPDALSDSQMQSVYSEYSEGADIEGFLSDNNLTPTVKYTENDNTNTGTATGLPAITFQSTDTYAESAVVTKTVPLETPVHVPHMVTSLFYTPFEDSIELAENTSVFSTHQTIVKVYKPLARQGRRFHSRTVR